jgi:2-polyprenyl-3-methyl-5-hydroxy-6-metoxy-1,4-benzoquinol methylase/RimJ/RimL family protein N-acetyltransferase
VAPARTPGRARLCHDGGVTDSPAQACRFETSRFRVGPWHVVEAEIGVDLSAVLAELLTEVTTSSLPDAWQGAYSIERARNWIEERDAESPTLLVVDRESAEPLGLVMLAELPAGDRLVDLRIGYLFAETTWGRGLATELVAGLVEWAAEHPTITTLTGGVAASNPASARVLIKNGFWPVEDRNNEGETIYRLDIEPASEWDEFADGWDADEAARAYAAAAFESLEALLEQQDVSVDGARICDFGCGTGLLTERLAERATEVIAVDSSIKMLEVLQSKIDQHGWSNIRTSTSLSTTTGELDLIVCSSVCSFLDDYPVMARNLAALLLPGGRFVQWDWERDENEAGGHGLTRSEITSALTAAGLEGVSAAVGFEVSIGAQTMRPLMGHGQRPALPG